MPIVVPHSIPCYLPVPPVVLVVSILCLIITDLHKHEKIQEKILSFLKSYYQKFFVIVEGTARHNYRLLKVFKSIDNTILCIIVGKREFQILGKNTEVH